MWSWESFTTTPIAATFLSVVEDFGLQMDDATFGPVLRAKQQSQKPPASEIKSMSRGSIWLFRIWNQLMLREQKLYRQYVGLGDGEVVQQFLIPECKKTEVLKHMHEGILGGYLGEEKTLGRIRERFNRPGYHNDVSDWCKTCSECAARKTPAPKRRALRQNIKVGSPLQLVAVDILAPFPVSEKGNFYILVIGDYFTRWMEAYPIPNQEAIPVSQVLI